MDRDKKIELGLYIGAIALWAFLVMALLALVVRAIIWLWRHMACTLLVATIALMVNHFSAE